MKKFLGYTLSEIIIVMLIITVIVSVSIKITKKKLDSIISINYYVAYSTLDAVAKSMIRDFKADTHINGSGEFSGCAEGQEQDNNGACVPFVKTVPRIDRSFCELFVTYINEDGNYKCEDNSANPDVSFDEPHIVMRNGMRLYHVSNQFDRIPVLENNVQKGSIYGMDNISEYAYTVYVDIDGEKGDSVLWEDVYPFYITLDGTVIPAYDKEHNGESGGNSKFHLQTSVSDEYVDNSGRYTKWYVVSQSFKIGACTAGIVGEGTAYCGGVATKDECKSNTHDCRMKVIKPVKFFGL